jgi:hypothetical protein
MTKLYWDLKIIILIRRLRARFRSIYAYLTKMKNLLLPSRLASSDGIDSKGFVGKFESRNWKVKPSAPTVRRKVLLQISYRSSAHLLQRLFLTFLGAPSKEQLLYLLRLICIPVDWSH